MRPRPGSPLRAGGLGFRRLMDFHPSRLRRGEVLAGVGAVLLLVFVLALKWYGHGDHSLTGWQALTNLRWLVIVTIACALALTITQATRRSPAVPATLSVIVTVLGLITVLALIYRVLIDPPRRRAGAAPTWGC